MDARPLPHPSRDREKMDGKPKKHKSTSSRLSMKSNFSKEEPLYFSDEKRYDIIILSTVIQLHQTCTFEVQHHCFMIASSMIMDYVIK